MHKSVLIAIGLVLAMQALPTSGMAAPRLVIDQPEFNFGYVPQNARISHVYWLKSAGDDTLRILKVTPGCGCTKAPLKATVLAPGDSTELEVLFSTGKYRNRISKAPQIATNEGSEKKRVTFTAYVCGPADTTYPLRISPAILDMSESGQSGRNEMAVTITNVSDQKLKVTLIEWPEQLINVELPESIGPGQSAQAEVTLRHDLPDESFEKSITLEVNDAVSSRFTIPIKRTVTELTRR
jgi:hypothetical protein